MCKSFPDKHEAAVTLLLQTGGGLNLKIRARENREETQEEQERARQRERERFFRRSETESNVMSVKATETGGTGRDVGGTAGRKRRMKTEERLKSFLT